MNKIILLLLILISWRPSLWGQDAWTLDRCIQYALENNIDIKSNQLNVISGQIIVEQAKLNYIPTLSAQSGYQLSLGRSLDQTTYNYVDNSVVNSFNVGVNIGTDIFAGLKKYNAYRKSLADLQGHNSDLDFFKNEISLSVTMYYLNVLLNKEIVNSLKKQIEISDTHIERMKRFVDEGSEPEEKLQNMMVQRSNETYSLSEAEGVFRESIINLCSLLCISDYANFQVKYDFLVEMNISDVAIEDIVCAAQELPQIESVKQKIKSAQFSVKLAKSEMFPTLSFTTALTSSFSDAHKRPLLDDSGAPIINNGSITYINYPFFSQLNNNRNGIFLFNLSVPIFNSLHARKNITLSNITLRKTEYELSKATQLLNEQIHKVYNDVQTAKAKYESAIDAVAYSEKILNHAENKLKYGTMSISDYIITKNNILMAQIQVTQAKYDYVFKQRLLNFYYTHSVI